MNRLSAFLLFAIFLLAPYLGLGQLFPRVADFHGPIVQITEKRYGKEMNIAGKDSGVFKPGKFSGWKFQYFFDEKSQLIKRINYFYKDILTEYAYNRNNLSDKLIKSELVVTDVNNRIGDGVEYENFIDSDGRIIKVNFYAIDQKRKTRELFLVEQNAVYQADKLISFTRHQVNEDGQIDTGETCELIYDKKNNLVRIIRKDIVSDLKTILNYSYNEKGYINHYSVDFMVGLPIYGKNPKQDIFYVCDRQGNWVRKYYLAGKKKYVEARRIIKYRKP